MEAALIPVEKYDLVAVFTDGNLDALLAEVETQALSLVPNVETARGRKEIASQAHKVARSKTLLDKHGKDLVADWKSKSKTVDAERRKARDFLDDLKAKVREPLDTWQAAEDERIAKHTASMDHMKFLSQPIDGEFGEPFPASVLSDRLESLKSIEIGPLWEEFEPEAERVRAECVAKLEYAIEKMEKIEAEAAELERLRKEAAEREAKEEAERKERERKDREERIRKEAAEEAKREAERALAAAEREAEEAKAAAELAAERAEEEKARAVAQAKADAEAKAEQERLARESAEAAEQERIRLEKEAAERKAKHHAHRAKVEREVAQDVEENLLHFAHVTGGTIVDAIKDGKIRHLEIKY